MDYLVNLSMRGIKTVLIRHCNSKAEARRKLTDFEHGQPDCEGIDWRIDRIYFNSGKMDFAEKTGNPPQHPESRKEE